MGVLDCKDVFLIGEDNVLVIPTHLFNGHRVFNLGDRVRKNDYTDGVYMCGGSRFAVIIFEGFYRGGFDTRDFPKTDFSSDNIYLMQVKGSIGNDTLFQETYSLPIIILDQDGNV